MELNVKNVASVLLFLLPGYFFLEGRHRHVPAKDLTTLQETAQFFISSLSIQALLIWCFSQAVDIAEYVNVIKAASVPDIVRDHLWIVLFYVALSSIFAHYAGRSYGRILAFIVDNQLGGDGAFIFKPALRKEDLLRAVMRQRHVTRAKQRRYVFVRVLMKDASTYEGVLRNYTFKDDEDYMLYIRAARHRRESSLLSQDGVRILGWENPPFDGVVVRSDAISSLEVSYRDMPSRFTETTQLKTTQPGGGDSGGDESTPEPVPMWNRLTFGALLFFIAVILLVSPKSLR